MSEEIEALKEVANSRVDDLIAWTEPLLELFAVVDTVMREDDWEKHLLIGMGRIRRQWQAVVKEFDEW